MTPGPKARIGSDMAANGPPPHAPAALYVGPVMHQRTKPVGHRFSYDVFSLLIDLDRLSEANQMSRLFSVNRRNVVSFFERDHTGESEASLRAYADGLLRQAGIEQRAARILLVCYPRILGYVFNPLSVYYAYAADGTIVALIYEVRNTFGERHSYVCPVEDGDVTPAGIRQQCRKLFHVSPFIEMAMRYRFRMLPPGEEIRWRILESDREGPLLAASFAGRRREVTTASLAGLLLRMPFLTVKIVGAIHWEALKLWLKGVRYIPRPAPPAPVSVQHESRLGEAAE